MKYKEARESLVKAADDLLGPDEEDIDLETERKAVRALVVIAGEGIIDIAESLYNITNVLDR